MKIDQPTSAPTAKVAAAGIGGSISVVIIYLVKVLFGLDLPGEVASAVTAIVAFTTGYFFRERS